MLTLPTPVAAVLGVCHLSVAVMMAVVGAHWLTVFIVVSISTAALFLRRKTQEVPCDAPR